MGLEQRNRIFREYGEENKYIDNFLVATISDKPLVAT
jgi:hypothetical protein